MSYSFSKEELEMYNVTALEHLKGLKDAVVMKDKNNGEDIKLEQTFQYGAIKQALYEHEELLKVPTKEEVCEALGKHFNDAVIEMETTFYLPNQDFNNRIIVLMHYDDTLNFKIDLPPYLIELVAKYYKGLTR